MLMLTRGHGESLLIYIDGKLVASITVRDYDRKRRKTRLGVEAYQDIVFLREEVAARDDYESHESLLKGIQDAGKNTIGITITRLPDDHSGVSSKESIPGS